MTINGCTFTVGCVRGITKVPFDAINSLLQDTCVGIGADIISWFFTFPNALLCVKVGNICDWYTLTWLGGIVLDQTYIYMKFVYIKFITYAFNSVCVIHCHWLYRGLFVMYTVYTQYDTVWCLCAVFGVGVVCGLQKSLQTKFLGSSDCYAHKMDPAMHLLKINKALAQPAIKPLRGSGMWKFTPRGPRTHCNPPSIFMHHRPSPPDTGITTWRMCCRVRPGDPRSHPRTSSLHSHPGT